MAEATTSGALQPGADRIRETAKWLAVSLGALGTVLVAGSQLSDVGELEVGSDRFKLAILGIGLAGVGAIVILWATTWTMTTPAVSLNSLATKTAIGTGDIVTDPTLLQGQPNVETLKTNYVNALNNRSSTWDAWRGAPTDPAAENAFKAADAHAGFLNKIMTELLGTVSYANLARRWRIAVIGIIVGGIFAASGVGLFAWAANPPADTAASTATPRVLTSPSQKSVSLTADGREALRAKLGATCPLDQAIPVLLLAKTDAGPDVLVQPSGGCEQIRFVVVDNWGTVSD